MTTDQEMGEVLAYVSKIGRAIADDPSEVTAHAILLRVLAEPRLPGDLSDELVEAIWKAIPRAHCGHRAAAEMVMDAIRLHLTPPANPQYTVRATKQNASTMFGPYRNVERAFDQARVCMEDGYVVTIYPIWG